jgi:hypothetical protein
MSNQEDFFKVFKLENPVLGCPIEAMFDTPPGNHLGSAIRKAINFVEYTGIPLWLRFNGTVIKILVGMSFDTAIETYTKERGERNV